MEMCGFEEILKALQTKYVHQQLNMVEFDVQVTVYRDEFL